MLRKKQRKATIINGIIIKHILYFFFFLFNPAHGLSLNTLNSCFAHPSIPPSQQWMTCHNIIVAISHPSLTLSFSPESKSVLRRGGEEKKVVVEEGRKRPTRGSASTASSNVYFHIQEKWCTLKVGRERCLVPVCISITTVNIYLTFP